MYAMSNTNRQYDISNVNTGYGGLYEAIWRKAVEDDYIKEKARLFYDITEKKYEFLLFYDKSIRDSFSKITTLIIRKRCTHEEAKEVHKEIKNLERVYEAALPKLKRIVQESVMKEAQAWPNMYRYYKDKEYTQDYRQLKEEILSQM